MTEPGGVEPGELDLVARALQAVGPRTRRVGLESHHLLVGFRPGRHYALEVSVAAGERAGSATLDVDTDPLPAHFPAVTVMGEGPVVPGHTLVSMRSTAAPEPREIAAVFDEDGEICWWLSTEDFMQDVRELDIGDHGGKRTRVRLCGVAVSGLEPRDAPRQLGLDEGSRAKGERLGDALDQIRRRFGEAAVQRAIVADQEED